MGKIELNRLYPVIFDALLIFSVLIVVTAGSFFIGDDLIQHFRAHPRHHRVLASLLSLTWIAIFAIAHWKGRLKKSSVIVRFICGLQFRPIVWVVTIFIFLASLYSYSSYIRHHVFRSSFDFAIFAQAIWNTWNGDFLYSSIKGGICLLGDHISPILVLFAPLYGFWSNSVVLLIVQAVVAASSVFPVYLIGKEVLKDNKLSLLFVIAYALYLPLRNAVRFDFHPELFADPCLLWAFYFILRNRLWYAFGALALALTAKETVCAPVAMLGLYCWWFRRQKLFGAAVFCFAVGVFLIDVKWIAPYFRNDSYFYLVGNYFAWTKRGLGAFLEHLFQPSTFTYLKKIFLPLGFLSFVSPSTLLLTGPILFQNLATRNELARSIYFQYTASLTPFVFVSAIHGMRNVLNWVETRSRWRVGTLKLIACYWLLGWSLLLMGVSEVHVIAEYARQDSEHWGYVRTYLKTIPSNVSVRTHEFFAPHLAKRKELHIYENQHPKEGGSEKAMNADYVILDRALLGKGYKKHFVRLHERGYVAVHEQDGFFVLAKNGKTIL